MHSERSRHVHSHSRKVTRDIAALDFLQNIPMRSEFLHNNNSSHHHKNGAAYESSDAANRGHKKKNPDGGVSGGPGLNERNALGGGDNTSSSTSESTKLQGNGNNGNGESLAGRRLPGFDATIVHMPPLFRYRFTTKYPAASAVVRRWEGMTAQQGLLGSRAYFSSGCGYPIATSTIIKVRKCNACCRSPYTTL